MHLINTMIMSPAVCHYYCKLGTLLKYFLELSYLFIFTFWYIFILLITVYLSMFLLLTMAGANSKANTFLLTIKDHIEALHDDSSHYCTSARLGHCELVAVLLG